MSDAISNSKRIGLMTSGGDAPGMNAAIRAVVRKAAFMDYQVIGFLAGYSGIIESRYMPLSARQTGNIIQRGGTILKAGRCLDMMRPEGRAKAAKTLQELNLQGLIAVGGDGTFRGCIALQEEHKVRCIGVPGTIDNDIAGTEYTIGFDTAVNTALSAIDKIRDTADSHDRIFVVEVMGRNCGYIATYAGLAGGSEEIFTPEYGLSVDTVVEKIKKGIQKGKTSSIVITAEGQKPGRAYDLAEALRKKISQIDPKVCILGHQQRGGSPTASDRILASRLGAAAVEALHVNTFGVMMGVQGGKVVQVKLEDSIGEAAKPPREYLKLASDLAT